MKIKNHIISIKDAVPFILVHLSCLSLFFIPITRTSIILCFSLYVIRMFGVTGGYHRYFSHKSFKTSRVMQFLFAILAQMSLQRGILKWANHHRLHHKNSDSVDDPHSPVRDGFWYAHVLWVFDTESMNAEYTTIKDLQKFPELVWLDKHDKIFGVLLGVMCFLIDGLPGLFVGFFFSTVLLFHGTFLINSLTHLLGSQRYLTSDFSRNNFLTAIITMGEGWHNNHHYYQASVKQGFFWWEIDITYYILKIMQLFGLVWDLKVPTAEIIHNKRKLLPYQRTNLSSLIYDKKIDFTPIQDITDNLKAIINHNKTDKLYDFLQMLKSEAEKLIEKQKSLPPKVRKIVNANLYKIEGLCNNNDLIKNPKMLLINLQNCVNQITYFSQTKHA